MPMREAIARPIQYAEKFPAVRPARTFRDAPPSRDAVTTSFTCPDFVDVKTLTSSGMIAPASVPHVMTAPSFHQSVPSPSSGMRRYETTKVMATETSDVIHTSERQRRLEVHLVGVREPRLRDRVVDPVGGDARDDHHDAHREEPDEELDLRRGVRNREEDERDERDAGHAVGLEAVGRRARRSRPRCRPCSPR